MIKFKDKLIVIAVVVGILLSIMGYIIPAFLLYSVIAGNAAGTILGNWIYEVKHK